MSVSYYHLHRAGLASIEKQWHQLSNLEKALCVESININHMMQPWDKYHWFHSGIGVLIHKERTTTDNSHWTYFQESFLNQTFFSVGKMSIAYAYRVAPSIAYSNSSVLCVGHTLAWLYIALVVLVAAYWIPNHALKQSPESIQCGNKLTSIDQYAKANVLISMYSICCRMKDRMEMPVLLVSVYHILCRPQQLSCRSSLIHIASIGVVPSRLVTPQA